MSVVREFNLQAFIRDGVVASHDDETEHQQDGAWRGRDRAHSGSRGSPPKGFPSPDHRHDEDAPIPQLPGPTPRPFGHRGISFHVAPRRVARRAGVTRRRGVEQERWFAFPTFAARRGDALD
jgi:hypothetical protein